jgi:RNA polymerase sigma factor (sigma-70 family)
LLSRYVAREGDSAESAFAALVERHGPMVFRVCRTILGDEHGAQDAFQATFLILARRAGSLWVRDTLGPWLYGVAYRTSSCARSATARRRTHERNAAERSPRVVEESEWDDIGPVLHEEVNRLPERYRSAVVLCYLEGLTHEQAAERLRCPVGTVRSRLATGRERLRRRLVRRGLAPSAAMLDASIATLGSGHAILPNLIEDAVRNASVFAATSASGLVPASVIALTERGARMMLFSQLRILSVAFIVFAGGSIGLFAMIQRGSGAQGPVVPAGDPSGPAAPRPGIAKSAQATRPDGPANKPKWRVLAETRVETAREILKAQMKLVQSGDIGLEQIPPWSLRLMEDRLRLAATAAERLAAIREHRDRMTSLELSLKQSFPLGRAQFPDVLKGRYYRLEAEQLLAAEEDNVSKTAPAVERGLPIEN